MAATGGPSNSNTEEVTMVDKRTISDVDGTLVTDKKALTKRAQAAVQRRLDAGIRFAVISGVAKQ